MRKEPEVISEMISNVDLDGLITEHCELLISIVPQESEVSVHVHVYIYNDMCNGLIIL